MLAAWGYAMWKLSILAAGLIAICSPALAEETTPYQFVSIYLHDLGTLEDDRAQAENDQAVHPGDFAACIRDTEVMALDLDNASKSIGSIHITTGNQADVAPQYISDFLTQKREAIGRLTQICSEMIQGPKDGVDYGSLAAESPKITARIEVLDKTLFQASLLAFATLIDMKADSLGHASHLVITRSERDELLATINAYFAKKLLQKDKNYAVSSAELFKSKLTEFSCSDDKWQ